jgi:hypothetical protein
MDEFDYDVADAHLICDNLVRTPFGRECGRDLAEVVEQGLAAVTVCSSAWTWMVR